MADIALILKDMFSSKANSIANANKGLSKSLEEVQRLAASYTKKLSALTTSLAQQKTQMVTVKKELQDAEKAFRECADAANEEALTKAYEKYENLKNSIADTAKSAKEAQGQLRKLNDESNRINSGGASDQQNNNNTEKTMLQALVAAGLGRQIGEALGNVSNAAVGSMFGTNSANYVSDTLSGAATGLALGAATGGLPGAVIGVLVGSLSGILNAVSKEIESKDEAFKSAAQENYDSAVAWRDGLKEGGSDTAAQREKDMISFDTLLGGGGKDFIAALSVKAAETPMEYADLVTLSKTLATAFGHTPDDDSDVDIMSLVQAIGDAGAAVGLDASGLNMVATAMTRMQATNKTTLEYLNLMQERGIDAVGMLAEGLETDKSTVYSMISKGEISGSDAVAILQEQMGLKYGGSMLTQSQTFAGKQSTLSDLETNVGNAYGEGYNAIKGAGLDRQIAFYEGAGGKEMQNAMNKWGAFEAEAENLQTDLANAALSFALTGQAIPAEFSQHFNESLMEQLEFLREQYIKDADGSEAGRVMAQAKAIAYSAYTETEAYKAIVETELALIEGVQKATQDGFWQAGWNSAEQWSKGFMAEFGFSGEPEDYEMYRIARGAKRRGESIGITQQHYAVLDSLYRERYDAEYGIDGSNAYGLSRVPYDGYRAVLHQGERVLTASEARQMDAVHSGSAVVTGNTFVVREEADIDKIAAAIVEELAASKLAYAG